MNGTSHPTSTSSTATAKPRLADGSLDYSVGLSAPQLRTLREIVTTNREQMLKAWNDYHEQASTQQGSSG